MRKSKKTQHPVIVQKLYDILVWVSPLVAKFPKDKRYTIGNRMESQLLDVLETLDLRSAGILPASGCVKISGLEHSLWMRGKTLVCGYDVRAGMPAPRWVALGF